MTDVAAGAEFASGTVPRTSPWLAEYLRTDFPEFEAIVTCGEDDAGADAAAGVAAMCRRG